VSIADASAPIPDDAARLNGLAVRVSPAEGKKCERCWTVTPDTGSHPQHPDVCPRCAEVLARHTFH